MEQFEGMTNPELLEQAKKFGISLPKRTPKAQILEALEAAMTLEGRYLGRRQEKLRRENGRLILQQVKDGHRFKYLIKDGRKILHVISTYHKAKAAARAIATALGKAFDIEKDYFRLVEA